MKIPALIRLFTVSMAVTCISASITAYGQCQWAENTSVGCGTPWHAQYSDCTSGTFSPDTQSQCVGDSSGSTQCNVQAVDLIMTVKQWTPVSSNGSGHCAAPFFSQDYEAGTCQRAVLGGSPCSGG